MNIRVSNISKLKDALKKDIIKASFYTGIATILRTISAFFASKIIAIYVGPSGLGLMGQLANFVNILLPISSFGLNNGITKFVAQYKSNEFKKSTILSTALKLTLISSVVTGLILIFGANFWSTLILKSDSYSSIFVVFGLTITLYSLNNFFLSVINGYQEYKKFNQINIITNIIGLIFTIVLSISYGIYGALLTQVTSQSVIFIITAIYIGKAKWFLIKHFNLPISKLALRRLFNYTLMTVISAIVMPVSQILVRNIIIDKSSLSNAGLWEGVNRISNLYLSLITLSLSTYYLPKLSEIKSQVNLRKEIFTAYKIFMPIVIASASVIYLLRKFIINLVFTDQFIGMESLFLFQLIGDVLKIAGWLLAFQMVAKAMTKHFIISEVIFSLSYYLLSLLFISYYGFIGAVISFAVNYLIYFGFMIVFFRNMLFRKIIY